MAQIGNQDYLSAGYVLTQSVRLLPEQVDPLPPEILSLSSEVASCVPDTWALEWTAYSVAERRTAADRFAIAPTDLEAVIRWVTARFDAGEFGWPCVFYSLDLARTFIQTFLSHATDLALLGMGVQRDIAPAFVEANTPPPGIGAWGYVDMLQRREALPPGGEPLGFEVVGLGVGALYSWLSNGWERLACRELTVCPGRFGLVGTFEEGMKAATHRYPPDTEQEVATLWQPWLVVRYPLAG